MKVDNHYVYILRCVDETYYTGYTVDIEKRIEAHESGNGAKYTRGRGPLSLVYEESFSSKSLALQREHQIKQLTRKQKENLINGGRGRVHEYSREFS
ncbi:GIY-YIG nuclease family protein [Evansella sp. AB-rgal1]|uniref:GIY-YIG nuclease family protein n=1 Tax=Evansella sp. AB-rgal1 TaxID=3242696 RepID=UPI00359E4B69